MIGFGPPSGETLASFATLTFLEIVLGIDNVVFLAIAVQRLAPEDRRKGRVIGQALAMILRILMLIGLVWATKLQLVLFAVFGHAVTLKDVVLIGGGLFLLAKGTTEIQDELEATPAVTAPVSVAGAALPAVVIQIGLINIVFSLDSVITAVGMTSELPVMIAAVVASTLVMLFAAKPVGDLIHSRPTMKMLAFAFILLVGVALVAEGIGFHIPRGYVYFAIGFSLFVEALNAAYRRVRMRGPPRGEAPSGPAARQRGGPIAPASRLISSRYPRTQARDENLLSSIRCFDSHLFGIFILALYHMFTFVFYGPSD
jgi:predicted tellurium resistance membrane protein TerC